MSEDPAESERYETERSEAERHETERYEMEREARRRAVNALSGRVAIVLVALFLAFLTYDSARTAIQAHARGDDWIYPPAVVGGICAAGLATLVARVARRAKHGVK